MLRMLSCATYLKVAMLFCTFLFYSCDKDKQHPVPYVRVDYRINLETTYALNSIGGWVFLSGGYDYNGIVVYRLSEDEFRAFDRTCTYNISERIVVEEPPIAECKDCESSYLLIDGSVVDGPAIYPLRQYQARLDYPYVYITN